VHENSSRSGWCLLIKRQIEILEHGLGPFADPMLLPSYQSKTQRFNPLCSWAATAALTLHHFAAERATLEALFDRVSGVGLLLTLV